MRLFNLFYLSYLLYPYKTRAAGGSAHCSYDVAMIENTPYQLNGRGCTASLGCC